MKLFILLIPFLGMHCLSAAFFHRTGKTQAIEKKETASFRMLPANLLFQFN
ncbi:MAG: hypothetical protein ACXVMS_04575 [Flavisolibacter sp.]